MRYAHLFALALVTACGSTGDQLSLGKDDPQEEVIDPPSTSLGALRSPGASLIFTQELNGELYAASAAGLYRLNAARTAWVALFDEPDTYFSVTRLISFDGKLWASHNGVHRVSSDDGRTWLVDNTVGTLVLHDERLFGIGTAGNLFERVGDTWELVIDIDDTIFVVDTISTVDGILMTAYANSTSLFLAKPDDGTIAPFNELSEEVPEFAVASSLERGSEARFIQVGNVLYGTSDEGRTWQAIPTGDLEILSVSYAARVGDALFVTARGVNGYVLAKTENLTDWSLVVDYEAQWWMLATQEGILYALDARGPQRLTNEGLAPLYDGLFEPKALLSTGNAALSLLSGNIVSHVVGQEAWEFHAQPLGSTNNQLYTSEGRIVLGSTSDEVYVSNDLGETWDVWTAPAGLFQVVGVSATSVFGRYVTYDRNGYAVNTPQRIDANGDMHALELPEGLSGLQRVRSEGTTSVAIVGAARQVVVSSTDGESWAALPLSLDETEELLAVFRTTGALWLHTKLSSGTERLLRSTDGGQSFTELPLADIQVAIARHGDRIYRVSRTHQETRVSYVEGDDFVELKSTNAVLARAAAFAGNELLLSGFEGISVVTISD